MGCVALGVESLGSSVAILEVEGFAVSVEFAVLEHIAPDTLQVAIFFIKPEERD